MQQFTYPAVVSKIHDGDTLDVTLTLTKTRASSRQARSRDVDLGFNVHVRGGLVVLEGQAVRLNGCNAPELATQAGRDALAYLETLVKVGDSVTLTSYGWDKYGGRVDGSIVLADGSDLASKMISAGHAAVWNGQGAKPVPATDPGVTP